MVIVNIPSIDPLAHLAIEDLRLILGFDPGLPSRHAVPSLDDLKMVSPSAEPQFSFRFMSMEAWGNAQIIAPLSGARFKRLWLRIGRALPDSAPDKALRRILEISGECGVDHEGNTTFELNADQISQLREIGIERQENLARS